MKPKWLLALVLGAIAAPFYPSLATAAGRSLRPQASWQVKAPMPVYEAGGAADSDGSAAYVAGGWLDPGRRTNGLYKYVLSTGTWSSLSGMPDTNAAASAVYYPPANKLYVFGGEVRANGRPTPSRRSYSVSARTRIYDIASDTWSMGAPMPDGRKLAASGYDPVNGKIYVVGGITNIGHPRDTTWEYDPVGNTWTVKAPIPHAVAAPGFGIVDGHLYVAGGSDDTNKMVDLCWNYDIAANSWSACARLPFASMEQGRGVANRKLYLFGGFAATNATVSYDPMTNSWSNGPTLNFARAFVAGAAVSGTLVAAGGLYGGYQSQVTETLNVTPPPLPRPRPAPPPPRREER